MSDSLIIPRSWAYLAEGRQWKDCIRMVLYDDPTGNELHSRLGHMKNLSYTHTANPGCFAVQVGTFIRPEVLAGTRFGFNEPQVLYGQPAYRWSAVVGVPWLFYGEALSQQEAMKLYANELRDTVPQAAID